MLDSKQVYQKSIEVLTKHIFDAKTIPTEREWNKMAVEGSYLTTPSISYISGESFPELCKKNIQTVKKRKGEMK